MHLLHAFTILSTAFLLHYSTAAITRDDLIIDYPPSVASPYNATMSISDDLTLRVDISTADSTPSDFLTYDDAANFTYVEKDNVYAIIHVHNKGKISELALGDWDIKGSLELSKGLVAKIKVNGSWMFSQVSNKVLLLGGG